ncbi:alpha/beta fold hydrolase [Streptomyces sp. NPDC048416]|uniref:alpha/beta fold hydrolase n=1 Tax=Streptomyces sp. NPDC048416 TaxID=3365546 RepID=UPI0037147235
MATFVLVPGAWKGSWSFESVVPLLERAGHTVHALTLTGLRPDDDAATLASTNLDSHADDVVRHLDRHHIAGATLVGHSYGGMVISRRPPTAPPAGSHDWCISTPTYRSTVSRAGRRRTTTSGSC